MTQSSRFYCLIGVMNKPTTVELCINHAFLLFRVVQVTKSLQDPLEVGNSLLGISDNVRE